MVIANFLIQSRAFTRSIKSYGRAPTFLLLTGYEQARSVVAAISGDYKSADQVALVLPESGVCSGPGLALDAPAQTCCGGPASAVIDACCVLDAQEKAKGKSGCGCGAPA
jgi:hypothetical protein